MIMDDEARPNEVAAGRDIIRGIVAVRRRMVRRIHRSYSWPGDPKLCVSAADFSFYSVVRHPISNLHTECWLMLLQPAGQPRDQATYAVLSPLLLASLHSVGGQTNNALWRLSSSSVTLPAYGPAGRRAREWSARRRLRAWAVGRPTLHGGPVRLRPVRATLYYR